MARIDASEALRLSEMLRIKLSVAEAERLAEDMSSVLDYVGVLDGLDVAEVDPMGAGVNEFAPLRDDVPGDSLDQSDFEMFAGGAYDLDRGLGSGILCLAVVVQRAVCLREPRLHLLPRDLSGHAMLYSET